MKARNYVLTLFILIIGSSAKADEGMWLMQLMQEQHTIDLMKRQGLKLNASEVYNPDNVSLKDAVGIFGNGCTGEIISPEGLILTNHHCGYSSIQQHSSVEHDYLTTGFWAATREKELATPDLKFTFIERIEDITDLVNQKITNKEITETESLSTVFLNQLAQELYEQSDLKNKKGITPQALPFYAGNRFFLIYKKVYTDIRMVAAPPSSIGKFGGETDNWMWPRHTGDFSIFRIYADANGEPADYNSGNVPLKTKKHLSISIKGIQEGDYAMIMGFPGSTSRYLTASEVKERMEARNTPRIRIREARLGILRTEMNASDKIRIQYASKYAISSNYWKNSIGMNKAIADNNVLGAKREQEKAFLQFAREQNNEAYQHVIEKIDESIAEIQPLTYQRICLMETFLTAIEFKANSKSIRQMQEAVQEGNKNKATHLRAIFQNIYDQIHDKDYNHEVDRKVAKTLFPLYAEMIPESDRPYVYTLIKQEYKGDYNAFIDDMYNRSILASQANLDKFLKKPTAKALENDLCIRYYQAIMDKYKEITGLLTSPTDELDLLHKTYIRGLCEMKLPTPSYPDANFTIRLTYGNVKSYIPRDGVYYNYYTTTKGILEKENPDKREFNVPAQLKELIEKADYGRYALPDGEMPVCFLSNTDITGGNSGSPVLNENGELIGCAFDGNWESLSGDIAFNDTIQRCISVDIRYVLFILEKLGGCTHLIHEMTIVE